VDVTTRVCVRCGAVIQTPQRRKYCDPCAKDAIREFDQARNRVRRVEQRDKLNAQSRALYAKHADVKADYHSKVRFGGLQDAVLTRDGNRCRMCGERPTGRLGKMPIHHIDGTKDNNVMENLIALCTSCHRTVHNRWRGAIEQRLLRALITLS
jgi:5-methylcytosine-specific restriction endonuclease McrA